MREGLPQSVRDFLREAEMSAVGLSKVPEPTQALLDLIKVVDDLSDRLARLEQSALPCEA